MKQSAKEAADNPIDESLPFNSGYRSQIAPSTKTATVEAANLAREAFNRKPAETPTSG